MRRYPGRRADRTGRSFPADRATRSERGGTVKKKLWIGLTLGLLLALLCCGMAAADASGSCGNNLTWTYESEDKILSITGTGDMADISSYNKAPWYSYAGEIQSIEIGNDVTSISRYAFYDCSSVTSVTIPRSVARIGYRAFFGCSSLTSVIILNPGAVIGDNDHDVFYNCPSTLILYGWNNSTAGDYADAANLSFTGWASSGKCGDNATWTLSESAYSLTISGTGATWKYLDSYPGFYAARIAIHYIEIEEGITELGDYIFYEMSQVTGVTMPESLTKIGPKAFNGCRRLGPNVTIPLHVTSIGDRAFYGCSELQSVRVFNTAVTFGSEVFVGCSSDLEIRSYAGSTALAYAASHGIDTEEWPVSGKCGDNMNWSFDPAERVLSITGKGHMYDYNYTTDSTNWYSFRGQIRSVVIGKGVTSVGNYAFYRCVNLTSVTLPRGINIIGDASFCYCNSLSDITFPFTVASIGKNAFNSCHELKSVALENDAAVINDQAFKNCTSLKSVTIPSGVRTIGKDAFNGCEKLKTVKIYNRKAKIGSDAFAGCASGLTIHGWPGSTAKTYASEHGLAFKTLAVPDPEFFLPASLTVLNAGTFVRTSVKAVVIPKSVTTIKDDPFARSGLQVIYGYAGSAAAAYANDKGYYFIGINDEWMASHKP